MFHVKTTVFMKFVSGQGNSHLNFGSNLRLDREDFENCKNSTVVTVQ